MSNKNNTNMDVLNQAAQILKEKKKSFIRILSITFVVSCLIIFPQPRYYACEVKLAPEYGSSSPADGIGSLAASFGFDLSNMQNSDAIYPLLYPELFESPEFLVPLFDIKVNTLDGKLSVNYHDYLKKHQKKNPLTYPFRKAYRLQLETMFFNGVTPFSSGGGPFQVLSLKKDGVRILNSANIMVISSFLHQLSLFFFMTVSVIANRFLKLYAESITIRNLCLFGYIICIIFMAFLLLIMFNEKFNKSIVKIVIKILNKAHLVKNKDEVKKKWLSYVDSLNEGSKIIRSNRKDFLICAFYNIVAMFAYIMVAYTVAIGMGINIEVYKVIITTSYVLMIGMFVPIPGGTGGLEYSFANMYANFINGGILGSFMLVWRFITYYVGIILGGIVLNFKKSSK